MIMKDMAELIKEYGYITPEIEEKNGISKYKFYKYVRENDIPCKSYGPHIRRNTLTQKRFIIPISCRG